MTGIQEEPEQEVPAEAEVVAEMWGEDTLLYPSERDYRDIQSDQLWDPNPPPGHQGPLEAAAKALRGWFGRWLSPCARIGFLVGPLELR